jgi:hypothetical protein
MATKLAVHRAAGTRPDSLRRGQAVLGTLSPDAVNEVRNAEVARPYEGGKRAGKRLIQYDFLPRVRRHNRLWPRSGL